MWPAHRRHSGFCSPDRQHALYETVMCETKYLRPQAMTGPKIAALNRGIKIRHRCTLPAMRHSHSLRLPAQYGTLERFHGVMAPLPLLASPGGGGPSRRHRRHGRQQQGQAEPQHHCAHSKAAEEQQQQQVFQGWGALMAPAGARRTQPWHAAFEAACLAAMMPPGGETQTGGGSGVEWRGQGERKSSASHLPYCVR
jgi:hypothetical protein